MHPLAKWRLMSIACIAAITLALGSVYIERVGPERAAYGNLCGPRTDDPCLEPVLKGGFPFAYLFDAPGISVERQLAFVEDQLHVGALVLDIAIYFAIVLSAILAIRRARTPLRSAQSRHRQTTRRR
jgi:hypothetical protein